MNTNLDKSSASRLVRLLAFALLLYLLGSCAAAQSVQPAQNVPQQAAQAAPQPPASAGVVCASADADKANQPRPEWQGSDLHRAIARRDVRTASRLLAQGVNPNEKDNYGNTPLLSAVSPLIHEPVPRPAAVVQRERQKETQAQFALIKELLAHHADVNLRGADGMTPLIQAAAWGYTSDYGIKILTLLLNRKAEVNVQDERGFTALMLATNSGRPETVKFLLARNANPELKNCAGETALSIAQSAKYKDPIRQEIIRALQGEK